MCALLYQITLRKHQQTTVICYSIGLKKSQIGNRMKWRGKAFYEASAFHDQRTFFKDYQHIIRFVLILLAHFDFIYFFTATLGLLG